MTSTQDIDRSTLKQLTTPSSLLELDSRLQRYSTHDSHRNTADSETIDDRRFLSMYAKTGTGTLTILDPQTQRTTVISAVNLEIIEPVAPVLAYAFEETRQGPKHCIEDTSPTAVLCMLRHIYTQSHYVPEDCSNEQLSLLLHLEIYHLAVVYDIATLKDMARVRVFVELELSTSYPGAPKDLCRALAYAYKHLPGESKLTATLAHYCIACFLQHKLDQDELFTTFHYGCRAFQRDLCLILRENAFRDEAAPTLVRLPINSSAVPTRYPVVVDADPLSALLDDESEDRARRRTQISRLDKLRIHFRVTLPDR